MRRKLKNADKIGPNKSSRCMVCQEPIYPTAKICNACHSYQDWRRFFAFGTVVLSLLVALISVTSAVGPQIIRMLHPPRSHLVVGSFSYTTSGISVWVENDGTKSGAIDKVTMVLSCKGLYFKRSEVPPELPDAPYWQRSAWGVDYDLPLDTSKEISTTIPPQSSKTFAYAISRTTLSDIENSFPKDARVGSFWTALYDQSIVMELDVQVSDSSGKVEQKHVLSSEPFYRLVDSLYLHRQD